MTRDEQVALVARIAAEFWFKGYSYTDGAERALCCLEAAEQAVDAKRGTERDWERLEAAANKVIEEAPGGGYRIILEQWDLSPLEELERALAALQPKERSEQQREENPYPLINCPSCGGGNEAAVRMDEDDESICAVWHCNLCGFEWRHESSVVPKPKERSS